MYDVIVVGGGPAGIAAGIYTSRKQMKTLFLSDSFGGQSSVSAGVENWIGDISIPGWELGQKLEKHLRAQEGIEIKGGELAANLRIASESTSPEGLVYEIAGSKGTVYQTRTVIIATGGHHRHLNVPGEEQFIGKGVVYCSTCDAPFFRNKRVAVVGSGNSALEAVEDLIPFASEITLVVRGDGAKGDPITAAKVFADPKVSMITGAVSTEVLGEKFVTGLRYQDKKDSTQKDLAIDGVFVEIGMVPNSDWVKDIVKRNEQNEIVINHQSTNVYDLSGNPLPGVYSAGDVADILFKQNNISAGYGVTAALSAYDYWKRLS